MSTYFPPAAHSLCEGGEIRDATALAPLNVQETSISLTLAPSCYEVRKVREMPETRLDGMNYFSKPSYTITRGTKYDGWLVKPACFPIGCNRCLDQRETSLTPNVINKSASRIWSQQHMREHNVTGQNAPKGFVGAEKRLDLGAAGSFRNGQEGVFEWYSVAPAGLSRFGRG